MSDSLANALAGMSVIDTEVGEPSTEGVGEPNRERVAKSSVEGNDETISSESDPKTDPGTALCLPFQPNETILRSHDWDMTAPPYLFRLHSPDSPCVMNEAWVKSKDAALGRATSWMDCFERIDSDRVANELNCHFDWMNNEWDNFVSWTSSLMLALELMRCREVSPRSPMSTLDTMEVGVIDTRDFKHGTFMKDLDLMSHFSSFDKTRPGLRELEILRGKPSSVAYPWGYYYGEYLSQGSLKVEGHIRVVPVSAIVNAGLHLLHPWLRFHEDGLSAVEVFGPVVPASKMSAMRGAYYQDSFNTFLPSDIDALIAIAELFGSKWKCPIAASLAALRPRKEDRSALVDISRRLHCADEEMHLFKPADVKAFAPDTLPEVQHAFKLLGLFHWVQLGENMFVSLNDFKPDLENAISQIQFSTERHDKGSMLEIVEQLDKLNSLGTHLQEFALRQSALIKSSID